MKLVSGDQKPGSDGSLLAYNLGFLNSIYADKAESPASLYQNIFIIKK